MFYWQSWCILVEPYCVFCRRTVLFVSKLEQRDAEGNFHWTPEPWQQEVIGFFCAPGPPRRRSPERQFVFRLSTRDTRWLLDLPNNKRFKFGLKHGVASLCAGCKDCDLDRTANFAHIPCLQLAKARLGPLSIHLLCEIAWLLRPVAAWRDSAHLVGRPRGWAYLRAEDVSASTEAGLLIHKAAQKLPKEIQALICNMMPDGLTSSLMTCMDTLDWFETLKKRPWQQPPLNGHNFPFESMVTSRTLRADTVDFMGEACLTNLTVDGDAELQLTLSDKPIKAVQYALGIYGVTAIRMRYGDGSTSPWLGSRQPSKWIKDMRVEPCFDSYEVKMDFPSEFTVKTDGHKIIYMKIHPTPREDSAVEVLWDRDIWERHNVSAAVIAEMSSSWDGIRLRGVFELPMSPYMRYAPSLLLPQNDGRQHSLTVFCNARGIGCIQVDGDRASRIGTPAWDANPISFYLRPNEAIELALPAKTRCKKGVYLLLKTTQGRYLSYLPDLGTLSWDNILQNPRYETLNVPTNIHENPALQNQMYEALVVWPVPDFVLFSGWETTQTPVGLFFDPGAVQENTFYSVGVMYNRRPGPEIPVSMPIRIPALSHRLQRTFTEVHYDKTFFTQASFLRATEVQVQRKEGLVRGLLATLSDGAKETLGRWDPSDTDATSTIYSVEDGQPLQSILFTFSDELVNTRQVVGVTVNEHDVTRPHVFWDHLERAMAWSFTYQYDYLEYWSGDEIEISRDFEKYVDVLNVR